MKFIVDELPYYGDDCIFNTLINQSDYVCSDCNCGKNCPREWDKYFVCSEDNPHQCEHLIEYKQYLKENEEQLEKENVNKSNHNFVYIDDEAREMYKHFTGAGWIDD